VFVIVVVGVIVEVFVGVGVIVELFVGVVVGVLVGSAGPGKGMFSTIIKSLR
jgi:hypothetical protein